MITVARKMLMAGLGRRMGTRRIFSRAIFSAPLKTSLALEKGTGVATFTRATTATVRDHEGIIRLVRAGEARFEGARRVENLISYSEDLTNAAWGKGVVGTGVTPVITPNYGVAPDGTMSASRVVFQGFATGDWSYILTASVPATSGIYLSSVWLKTTDGSTKTLKMDAGIGTSSYGANLTVTGAWTRFTVNSTGTTLTARRFALYLLGAGTVDVLMWHPQLENVTGQSVKTAGEYVSNGAIRRNLLTYSGQLNSLPWGAGASTTITANYASAPDGTVTATRLQMPATGGTYLQQAVSLSVGAKYTLSFYVKGNGSLTQFDLFQNATGVATQLGTQVATLDWARYIYTFTASAGSVIVGLNNATDIYASDILVWGAQLEPGSTATPYQKVTDASPGDFNNYHGTNVDGVKYFDTKLDGSKIPDAVLKGYLSEGQRTNLLTYSADFSRWASQSLTSTIQTSGVSAPDGSMTAYKIVPTTEVLNHSIWNNVLLDGTIVTFSLYARAAERRYVMLSLVAAAMQTWAIFDLQTGTVSNQGTNAGGMLLSATIKSVEDGWYRINIVGSLPGYAIGQARIISNSQGTYSYDLVPGDGISGSYIWAPQVEVGYFPSSYIPTAGATVTRNADVLKYQGSGNIDISKGALYAESQGSNNLLPTGSASGVLFSHETAPLTNAVSLFGSYSSTVGSRLQIRNAVQTLSVDIIYGSGALGMRHKHAAVWDSSQAKTFFDGTASSSDTSVLLPSSTGPLWIGAWGYGSAYIYGTIRNVKVWNTALTDSELTKVTK